MLLLFILRHGPQVSSGSKCNRRCTYFISIKYHNREMSPRLQAAKLGACTGNTNKIYQIHSNNVHWSLAGRSCEQPSLLLWKERESVLTRAPPNQITSSWQCVQPLRLNRRNKSWRCTTTLWDEPHFPGASQPSSQPCAPQDKLGATYLHGKPKAFCLKAYRTENWIQATAIQPAARAFTQAAPSLYHFVFTLSTPVHVDPS